MEVWLSVIGYDSITGRTVEHPNLGPDIEIAALTHEPRQYGFHATLKAPFRLNNDATQSGLLQAAEDFAQKESAIQIGELAVRPLGSFIALKPPTHDLLQGFAERCVRAFEHLRALMSKDERAKRLRTPLTQRQIELMEEFGYPYVLEEFRFHMTLTSSLSRARIERVNKALTDLYQQVSEPVMLSSICVCAQSPGEPFPAGQALCSRARAIASPAR